MLKLLRNKKGVTLIELLVVLAILGIIILMTFSIQIFGVRTSSKGQNKSNAQYNVRMAAAYITKEIRNAQSIEILSAMPAIPDTQKKYIYTEGNTIKHYIGGVEKDILNETSLDFTPALTFSINASNDNILNFSIQGTYNGEQFNVTSEVLPMNMVSGDNIVGTSGGSVISFGPFTDAEAVNIDKSLLNLKDYNLNLIQELDGSFTLPPPPPINPMLNLEDEGINDSEISWISGDQSIIKNDGTVVRPGINAGNKTTTLTATLTKGTESTTKVFTVNISDLDPLIVTNTTLPAATSGTPYEHIFTASGGYESYTYSTVSTELTSSGLTLHSNGILDGIPTGGPKTITFTVVVTDGFNPVNTITISPITLVIN